MCKASLLLQAFDSGAITEILRVAIDQIYGRIAIENFDSLINVLGLYSTAHGYVVVISRYGTIQP